MMRYDNLPRLALVALKILILAIACLPIITLMVTISDYGLSIPFYDQWDTSLDMAIAAREGELSIEMLARQHGDHRIFFTNLTTAFVTYVSNWDLRVERLIVLLLVTCIALLVLSSLYRQDSTVSWWATIPFIALLFAVRGRQTYLVSFQTAFVYPILFATVCLYILQHLTVSWRAFAYMSLATVCCTFSVGSGLVLWGAMLPGFWFRGYRRVRYYAIWIMIAALAIALYFSGFILDRSQSELALALARPASTLAYIVGYLGGVFVVESPQSIIMAIVIGVIGLVLFALNIAFAFATKRGIEHLAMWIGLAGFALGLAGLTAIGRISVFLGESSGQPLSERYIVHSVLFWVALVALFVHNQRLVPVPGRVRHYGRLLKAMNIAALALLSLLYVDAALQTSRTAPFPPRAAEACLRQYVVGTGSDDCFWQFYPPMFPHVPERISLYVQYGFAGASQAYEATTQSARPRTTPGSSR